MTPSSMLWGLTAGPVVFVAVALIAAGAVVASRGVAVRDRRLTSIDTASVSRFGVGPAWLQLAPWSSVAAGIAVAHLAGPGAPWWLAAAVGVVAGLLIQLTSGRIVVLLAVPGAIAMAMYLVNGTGCSTGLGRWALAIVPAAALAAHLTISWWDTDGGFWWRPELVAAVTLVATQLVVTPAQHLFGLAARPPHVVVIGAVVAISAVLVVSGLRHQLGLGAAALGVVALQLGVLTGAGLCRAEPVVMLCSILGAVVGAAVATMVHRRFAIYY